MLPFPVDPGSSRDNEGHAASIRALGDA